MRHVRRGGDQEETKMTTPHGIPEMKKGQRWSILNRTLGGTFIVEGFATLVRPTSVKDQWMVRFDGESELFPRTLDVRAQRDPAKYVANLNDRAAQRR